MASFVSASRLRATITVVLVSAASFTAASAPVGASAPTARSDVRAQELPAGVASELVDRALEQQLDVASPERPERLRSWLPQALSGFAMALSVIILIVGWVRGDLVGSEAPAADEGTGAAERDGTHHRPVRRGRTTRGSALGTTSDDAPGKRVTQTGRASERADDSGAQTSTRRSTPSETLVLPDHVTAVLARAEAKRREAGLAAEGGPAGPGAATDPDPIGTDDPRTPETGDPDPPTESLDLLVPGYDPWKGR